jgi:hypothetical protein
MTNPHIDEYPATMGPFVGSVPTEVSVQEAREQLIQKLRENPNSYADMMQDMSGICPES